ncbi:hypothetical protein JHK82_040476 [Glycine max]|nr:hypothetical protein JHK87_040496 [Glycine soja]KAG4963799.1 hypothetical protein JHK86_040667 [Glycine max]KAG4966285.1 hypothetical protein JHK85_041260 [Glycine max]KAG5111253.1 hypothetical protein JHK82_040476 [Glycine max]KAG5122540.1 hypothetical protein JHK84_040880 [Glycine max]
MKLWDRGCNIVSVCNLCEQNFETSDHLFFWCPFSVKIWNWKQQLLNKSFDCSSIQGILSSAVLGWSPQMKDTVLAAVIFSVSKDKVTGNMTSAYMSNSISEFSINRALGVVGYPRKSVHIIQVNWFPPLYGWVKCNSDGSAKGSPRVAGCGDIFTNHRGDFLGDCWVTSVR